MELVVLIVFVLLVWYFWKTLQVKETALKHVKAYGGAKEGIQVLDEVVSHSKLRMRRNAQGHVELVRHFSFEFSSLGDVRYQGLIVMYGNKLADISIEPYEIDSQES